MTIRQPQVFISYQRADEPFARQVREHLSAHGVQTWMDQFDIPVGAYWPDEIDRGLRGSDIVVGLLSPDSVESRNVKNEWDWAIQNNRRLVLMQVAACLIPHRYVSINFIDATGPDHSRALAALTRSLGIAEADDQISDAATPTPIHHSVRVPRPTSRTLPFIAGREREQTILRGHLDRLIAGEGSLVLIGGEAGIGKTTLTSWMAAEADGRGAVVLAGGCYDLTTTPPYGPWGEIVRGWPDDRGLPPVPDALRGGEAMARLQSQVALFELAADLLATAGIVRPLVVLLEDLHWADQPSLELLRYLGRLVTGFRLMLVATYRDDEITRRHALFHVLPALAREPGAERINLSRLSLDAAGQLVASRYVLDGPDRERLAVYIQQAAEGNPFFATEMLRSLAEAGTIARDGDGWRVGDLAQVPMPELVRQVIEGRLDRLGDDARRLLAIAAVIGHEVDIDIWTHLCGSDEEQLVSALERATEARLVEEMSGQSRMRFTHALIRETLYSGLVSIRRRSLHRQAGEYLAGQPAPDPDLIAAHFVHASDPRAACWLELAGERAQLSYAWSTAVDRYERALELLAAIGGEPREIAWLQYRIARLQRFRYPEHALEYVAEAQRLAAQIDDRALAAAARFTEGLCQFFLGNIPAAIAGMSDGADLLEALPAEEQWRLGLGPDDAGVPSITNPRGFLVVVLAVAGWIREAIEMGERLNEGLPKRTALAELGWSHYGDRYSGLGTCYAFVGRVDEAIDAFSRARDIFRENGHYSTQAVVAHLQISHVSIPYRTDQSHDHQQLAAEATAANARAAAAVTLGTDSSHLLLLWLRGDWDAAAVIARASLTRETAATSDHDYCHEVLALIAVARGEWDEAWSHVRRLLPSLTATEPGTLLFYIALSMQRVVIEIALQTADLTLAREWLAAHEHWLDWSGALLGRAEHQVLLARYHQLAGDADAALAAADAAVADASDPRQPLALAMAYRTRGEIAIDHNHLNLAANDLQASLTLTEACAAPYERTLTLTAMARLAIAAGNDPAELLAEARTICERLEARPALERIVELEQRGSEVV